jgi:hypothetical protein
MAWPRKSLGVPSQSVAAHTRPCEPGGVIHTLDPFRHASAATALRLGERIRSVSHIPFLNFPFNFTLSHGITHPIISLTEFHGRPLGFWIKP